MKDFKVTVKIGDVAKTLYLRLDEHVGKKQRNTLAECLGKLVKSNYTIKLERVRIDRQKAEWLTLQELILMLHNVRLYKSIRTLTRTSWNVCHNGVMLVLPDGVQATSAWVSSPNVFIKLESKYEYLNLDLDGIIASLNRQDLQLQFKRWSGPTGTGIYSTVGYKENIRIDASNDIVNITWDDYTPKYEWVERKVEL